MTMRYYLFALLLLLSACASKSPDVAYQEVQPGTAPVKTTTTFDDGLACLDRQLADAAHQPIYITSPGVSVKSSGELETVGGLDMMKEAIASLRRSNLFRFVDLDSGRDSMRQEAPMDDVAIAQRLQLLPEMGGDFEFHYPDYIIKGLFTIDERVTSLNGGGSVIAGGAEIGLGGDQLVSVLTLSLHAQDGWSHEMLNLGTMTHSLALVRRGRSGDIGGRVKNSGVFINLGHDRNEGIHQGMRVLMRLTMIELLGRLANVPEGSCENSSAAAVVPELQLHIEPAHGHSASYRMNETIKLSLHSNRDAHAHCFMQMRSGIYRFFPYRPDGHDSVTANVDEAIPGLDADFHIRFEPGEGQQADILCLASEQPLVSTLQSSVNAEGLPQPVNASSLRTIQSSYGTHVAVSTLHLERYP